MLKPTNMSDSDIIRSIREKANSKKIDENTNRTIEKQSQLGGSGRTFDRESWVPDRSVPKSDIYKEYDPYAHLKEDGPGRGLLGRDSISKSFFSMQEDKPTKLNEMAISEMKYKQILSALEKDMKTLENIKDRFKSTYMKYSNFASGDWNSFRQAMETADEILYSVAGEFEQIVNSDR